MTAPAPPAPLEPARIVSDAFPLFYSAYREWIKQGFGRRGGDAAGG